MTPPTDSSPFGFATAKAPREVGPALRDLAIRLRLRAIHRMDLLGMRVLDWFHPGLEIDPTASANLVKARFNLAPGARLRIGPGVTTERRSGGVNFLLEEGAVIEIGEGVWLRTEVGSITLEDLTLEDPAGSFGGDPSSPPSLRNTELGVSLNTSTLLCSQL